MFGLKPARRWQPAFRPFKTENAGKRLLASVERIVKGPAFGCRMCGNCLLQETAFICPMECPKGMRNGPCGGIAPGKMCYVDITRKCVWTAIYERSFRTGRQEKLMEVLPPMDWNKAGSETWGDVIRQIRKTGTGKFVSGLFSGDGTRKNKAWEDVFMPVRQPQWWQGDSEYHPPLYAGPASILEEKLMSGDFVIATELTPPAGASTARLECDIDSVKPYADAINFTDSSSARPKMSSVACCRIATDRGAEAVLQVACRDTNRTGLQATALGLNAMGIRNVLCITGDNASTGCPPIASMNIVDIDSVQMLWILRRMRDDGIYLDGRKINNPPRYFIGAATSPFALEPKMQAIKDHKKVNAGAQFFQTNVVFEPDRLDLWLEELDKRGVLGKVYILVGIAPLKSYKIAEYLHNRVPGVKLPEKVLERMRKAGASGQEEGISIALEMIESVKSKKGVNGIHIMTLGWEAAVARIVTGSGIRRYS